mgnify:CR=1 FL=1
MEGVDEDDEIPSEVKEIKGRIAVRKKQLKTLISELTEKVIAEYDAMAKDEGYVIDLVVEEKWCKTLGARMHGEYHRVMQQVSAEVQSLAARYAETLPDLEARVKTLRGKVAAHLKEMGVEA